MNNEALKQALEAAYLAGFNASGEGYNGEYPFGDHARNPEEDAAWIKDRDNALREALAEQPAPMIRGDIRDGLVDDEPAQQEPIHVPVTDNTYNYAKSLAEAIFKQHFASDEHYASGRIVWGVNDTVIGILTQIDNMVADMVRRPAQQQEPGRNHWEDGDVFERISAMKKQPAQRTWVGLTDDEILIISRDHYNPHQRAEVSFARAIEAKLKEKNA